MESQIALSVLAEKLKKEVQRKDAERDLALHAPSHAARPRPQAGLPSEPSVESKRYNQPDYSRSPYNRITTHDGTHVGALNGSVLL